MLHVHVWFPQAATFYPKILGLKIIGGKRDTRGAKAPR
jgi:hypothetical protein